MRRATRYFSTAVTNHLQHIKVLAMPALSPSMKVGIIVDIYLEVGQKIKSYDLCLQISTTELCLDTKELSNLEI